MSHDPRATTRDLIGFNPTLIIYSVLSLGLPSQPRIVQILLLAHKVLNYSSMTQVRRYVLSIPQHTVLFAIMYPHGNTASAAIDKSS